MGFDDEDHPSNRGKNTYDLNSKIMITAIISLSFAVILVTILHIYARFVIRRQARRQTALRRLGFITSAANVQLMELPKTGLDPSVMASLPIFVFKQTNGNSSDEMGSSSMECSVCLSLFEDGEMARTLPNCKHTFHAECIDKWFESNSTCPICRMEAEPRLVAEPREDVAAPSSPPLHGANSLIITSMEGTADGGILSTAKIVGSSSRLSSFRRILSRERSFRRIQSCGQEDGLPDLERQ
ncbi:E3 ubiquitin-protein ligase ATL41-like [Olea europaea var. sylvestris]|uniref:RING-type E3 ubiquitin transferase n=1 Tax=Olea europaea subsp. europaea TaxID=158383 RepID=A0A8S0TDK6_OLEEU|nr:E3 ubiquitin-protein ligase ATL41-like [Olea europaea var. sylvestris]CAA3003001.1 E3 ubiquitin- ligase ATL41-like [Olea europaea subsp. europaea]